MDKITDYQIITPTRQAHSGGSEIESIEDQIRALMEKGWQPYGSPFAYGPGGVPAQAMVIRKTGGPG